MKPHTFQPDAAEEYTRAVQYYTNINRQLGVRFHEEIEWLIKDACRQPERYFRFDPPAQRVLGRKFPYSVVYLNQPDQV